MKFNEIWKVNLKSFDEESTNQYILISDEESIKLSNISDNIKLSTNYNIVLTNTMNYNTDFYIDTVVEKYPVSSLQDILDFCYKNSIVDDSIEENRIVYGLFVGEEKNDLISNSLELMLNYKPDVEQNIWINTDDTQWIKYIETNNKSIHIFKVVDSILVPIDNSLECIFRAVDIYIDERDLLNGYYDEELSAFHNSLDEIVDGYKNSYPQIVAECIAEYNLLNKEENNAKDIFKFNLSEQAGSLDTQIHLKCKEVEDFLVKNL